MTKSTINPEEKELQIRWMGKVRYRDALAVQQAINKHERGDYLLLLEHHPVYTMGIRASLDNLKTDPETIGAELEEANRGGDITFHGPGQLVGYPLLKLKGKRGGGMADTAAYVNEIESLLIETCKDLGIEDVGRIERYTGVWVNPNGPEPRKIAAIGVRLNKARTMHGFALNVNPDMTFYDHIVPCGITEYGVTSLEKEGINTTMKEVVDLVSEKAERLWSQRKATRADVLWGNETNTDKSVVQIGIEQTAKRRKPEWMKVKLETGPEYRRLKKLIEEKKLVTVCEEAGCPNIFDCWNDGTATFMIGGERCTRACGFCLVDTRKPKPLDMYEPKRVAMAVAEMGLRHAVVTSVARDDLKDGGAEHFAMTINMIREINPKTKIEVLIPDFKGDPESLNTIFEAKPDVLNHNIETVPRLQRRVRPSAGYARSLSVLARANKENFITKTSLMVGLGEQESEIDECLVDLAAIGCDIVTIGQYLRPSPQHLPIKKWVNPIAFKRWKIIGENLGISHVEASPLTRSSYHARQAFESTNITPVSIGRPELVLADS
ncbi:MAG: lipoyl synthase [Dehalococcoidia bacterium]|nr:lipoyl synthase [Dehalococcoidia bacterium]|tara:strand:- start:647 stop:2296 length:1650 start_codon:yes stop_codon:yes gene_type:complete